LFSENGKLTESRNGKLQGGGMKDRVNRETLLGSIFWLAILGAAAFVAADWAIGAL